MWQKNVNCTFALSCKFLLFPLEQHQRAEEKSQIWYDSSPIPEDAATLEYLHELQIIPLFVIYILLYQIFPKQSIKNEVSF